MKVLIAVHPYFRPDRAKARASTPERDAWRSVRRIATQTEVVGVSRDWKELERTLVRFRPDVVFNLLEEFRGEAVFDFHMISHLEALGIPFTGCNPRGMILSRNKFLLCQVLQGLGVQTPRTDLVDVRKLQRQTDFPLFVKLNREHASLGITESNRVTGLTALRRVVQRLRVDYGGEVVVQDFIAGRDVTVSVWGNRQVQTFAPRILFMSGRFQVATEKLKFSRVHQRRRQARSKVLVDETLVHELQKQTARLYPLLDLSGYARFDFRVDSEKKTYLIDINANPNLARGEDFARSAHDAGWSFDEVVEEILRLAQSYQPRL